MRSHSIYSFLFAGAAAIFGPGMLSAHAGTSSMENAGRAVAIALPVAASGIAAWKDDWNGVGEIFLVTAATVGTAYGLKHVVHEDRPDHSDMKSFPSDTSALAFAPAQTLWDRYGWTWGVPAYAAAAFVGYSRVDARKHHWWDVAASAGIAWGYSALITTRYHRNLDMYSGVYATPNGAMFALDYHF